MNLGLEQHPMNSRSANNLASMNLQNKENCIANAGYDQKHLLDSQEKAATTEVYNLNQY